jgi:hypothetical protein
MVYLYVKYLKEYICEKAIRGVKTAIIRSIRPGVGRARVPGFGARLMVSGNGGYARLPPRFPLNRGYDYRL